jgi:hypothetical protein
MQSCEGLGVVLMRVERPVVLEAIPFRVDPKNVCLGPTVGPAAAWRGEEAPQSYMC